MTEPEKPPSLLALFLGWANIGLTSVGGAAGPLRHVIVKQRKWLGEAELAELFGVAQALPGATAVNIAVMLGDRFAGLLGPLVSIVGLVMPSLILAVVLAEVATNLAAANIRFAAAETAITASVAGVFIANGIRLIKLLWTGSPDVRPVWRLGRVVISLLGVLLVAGLHLFIPFAMLLMLAASVFIEARLSAGAQT